MNDDLAKPRISDDGRIIADEGPPYYLLLPLPNGDERCALISNAAFQVHSTAKRWSTDHYKLQDCLVVRADMHQALYYYKAGQGLQEGWQENDPEKAQRRKAAYQRGEKIIRHAS